MSEKFGGERTAEPRPVGAAMGKGALRCCPNCGQGRLFAAYVKIAPRCPVCGVDFSPYRADDGPAYFTIFLVGHIILPLMLWLEQAQTPELWVHMALWMPLTLLLSLGFLPLVKGAVVGLQWALDVKNDDQK